jgi:hypothetical protein
MEPADIGNIAMLRDVRMVLGFCVHIVYLKSIIASFVSGRAKVMKTEFYGRY